MNVFAASMNVLPRGPNRSMLEADRSFNDSLIALAGLRALLPYRLMFFRCPDQVSSTHPNTLVPRYLRKLVIVQG